MEYVWDRRKNRINLAKHKISFEDAIQIFEGPTLERIDDRFDYGEVRVYAIGVTNGLEVTLIYTDVTETKRRINSAWRAERNERTAYWQSIGQQGTLN